MNTAKSGLPNNVDAFVPTKDVNETLEDGRIIQKAVKGVPIPRAEAVRLGLTDPVTTGEAALVPDEKSPAELHNEQIAAKRGAGPTENKAAKNKPAEK